MQEVVATGGLATAPDTVSLTPTDQQGTGSGLQASFGKNRLAGGFARSHSSPDLASFEEVRGPRQPNGSSQQDAIELSDSSSDDEMAHSDGGMAVNLVASDDSESDHWMEEEIKRLSEPAQPKPDTNADVNEPASGTLLRLADLSPDDLEDQLRYGLYHLQRHQIDLNRPVTCLACLREGHMADSCPETHCSVCGKSGSHSSRVCPESGTDKAAASSYSRSFFPPYQPDRSAQIQLWISCCICASKSHLAGDCPDVDKSAAVERWSLKALDPSQIVNLSLQTGTREREREAESRGMRPPGRP
ncbi:hypothetical protein DV738_g3326, partial [Chaetothyriales sp. CBS 135597]